ncbi:carboxylesterase type B [Amycolatopsis antarctica]|uniref:Carboxylic ester hydrolase n=1 Tax=Amycolatopsis antarctica TaxID=1854586 RepID=A0A263CYP8_9PSEU|nr:carboxylesterase family protein [Amycolatopsis antarctica]OZM71282.1 carboxylesterase type B [Amycolatopsis antarctica]
MPARQRIAPWKKRTLIVAFAALTIGSAVTATSSAGDPDRPLVPTTSGPVVGERAGAVERYQGIPYAAPPTGDLRWASPREPRPWTSPREAAQPGPACPQLGNEGPLAGTSEDCLSLNVTTPRARPGAGKPVMVWLHGGSNTGGTSSQTDPARMADRGDVVVVTVNYRLGMLGFFSHPGLEGSGTFALQDQQAALRWVQRNAVFFGGDPGKVTLFGESAGGIDTCAQLTSPAARGLFGKVILQSGSCSTEIAAYHDGSQVVLDRGDFWSPVEQMRKVGGEVAAERGCATEDPVDCLRGQPADELVGAYDQVFGIASGTPTLPMPPDEALAEGRFHRVPVLSGTTRDESRLVTDVIGATSGPITQERLDEVIDRTFGEHAGRVRETYPVAEHGNDPRLAFAAMDTDRTFACTQLASGRALARHVPTYGYEFADRGAPTYSPFLTDLPAGAAHASELAYLFDLELGPWGPGFQQVELTGQQRALGDTMIDAWTTFAGTGRLDWAPLRPDSATAPVRSFAPEAEANAPMDAWAAHHCDLWSGLPGGAGQPGAHSVR